MNEPIAVPPDQQALGLVEAILNEACISPEYTKATLQFRLSVIQGTAERLAVLLAAEREGLVTALERALPIVKDAPRAHDELGPMHYCFQGTNPHEVLDIVRAALARVKGAE